MLDSWFLDWPYQGMLSFGPFGICWVGYLGIDTALILTATTLCWTETCCGKFRLAVSVGGGSVLQAGIGNQAWLWFVCFVILYALNIYDGLSLEMAGTSMMRHAWCVCLQSANHEHQAPMWTIEQHRIASLWLSLGVSCCLVFGYCCVWATWLPWAHTHVCTYHQMKPTMHWRAHAPTSRYPRQDPWSVFVWVECKFYVDAGRNWVSCLPIGACLV